MGIEGAAREADVRRPIVAKALHRGRGARTPRPPEIPRRASCRRSPCLRARRSTPGRRRARAESPRTLRRKSGRSCARCTPRAAARARQCRPRDRSGHCAPAVEQRRVTRRGTVGMEPLQGVHQHASDVLAGPQYLERVFAHLLERVCFVGRRGLPAPAARRPTSHGTRHRSAPGGYAWCGSGPSERPASRPRCRTCETTPRRDPRSRAAPHVVSHQRMEEPSTGPSFWACSLPRSMHSL